MSAPIRPLPPSAVGPSAPAAETESFPQTSTEFSDLLDLQVEDAPEKPDEPATESKDKPASSPNAELWTILGVAPSAPPIPQIIPVLPEGTQPEAGGQGAEPVSKSGEGDVEGNLASDESKGVIDAKVLQGLVPSEAKQKLPPDPKFEAKEEQIAGKEAERAGITSGTPSAKQPAMMFTNETHADISSASELQGIASNEVAASLAKPAVTSAATLVKSKELSALDTHKSVIEAFLSPAPLRASGTEFSTTDVAPRPVTQLEPTKVIQSVSSQIQLLRTSQIGELKVIVRPDAQTELYLHITRADGAVCVQARCDRGDFAWLDANWGVVQNALSTHGVKVEPLQAASRNPEQPANSFSGDHHSPRRENRTSSNEFGFDAEPAQRNKNFPRQSTTTSRARGWQSWA